MKSIKQWQEEVHKNAVKHGQWEYDFDPIFMKLCLIHSEVSEAVEGIRNRIPWNHKNGLGEELADIVIRVFDLAEHQDINIEEMIEKKHKENLKRLYKHGKKF